MAASEQVATKPSLLGRNFMLILVKSKPPGRLIKGSTYKVTISFFTFFFFSGASADGWLAEHFERIRSYIKAGRRPILESDCARYVDTLSFWKDSHQRQQNELEDLKRQIDSLKGQLNARQDGEYLDPIPPNAEGILAIPMIKAQGKKRKRGDEGMVSAPPANSCNSDTLDVLQQGPYGMLVETSRTGLC